MSKVALAVLAKELGKDALQDTWQGSSKEFRQKHLDYKKQYVVDTSVEDIEAQLRIQFLGYDNSKGTNLHDKIDQVNGFPGAAQVYLDTLNASFTKDELAAAQGYEGIKAVVNNYDGLNKRRIAPAEKAARAYLKNALKTDEVDQVKKLLSPDHTYPNAEIRFSRALYNTINKRNPELDKAQDVQAISIGVLNDLANVPFNGRPLVAQETIKYFVDSFVKISSRFTGNLSQKEFDLEFGAELAPRSQYDNEEHGRVVQSYVAELAKAAAIIAGKQNWAAQESSDSYKTAVFKQLNNAAVKAGAAGKLQTIDSKPATSTEKRRFQGEDKITRVMLGSKKRPQKRKTTKSDQSLVSLQSIVDYINARLPKAMQDNMGPGSLNYRTGRLANSAKITSADITSQGFPSLAYTYLRSPYDVFDPILGRDPWNTPGRSPSALVQKSVRDIARDMAIGRFYLRRV